MKQPINNQEAFNTMVSHIRGMKKKSIHNGLCRYRTPDGNRCAIGVLIPDEMYDSDMDKTSTRIDNVIQKYPILAIHLQNVSTQLMTEMQSAHDTSDWGFNSINPLVEVKFKDVAQRFNLTMPSD